MPATISIAVVDDHPIFREGVIRVLRAEPTFRIVGEGNSAEEAVRIAATKQPDVILLDVSMPGGGLEAARAIATTAPLTNIMMLTVVDDDSIVVAALEAGAKGYVLKGISGPDLVGMIMKVLQSKDGSFCLSPGVAAHILAHEAEALRSGRKTASGGLTDLDRRILTLISNGWSLERIGVEVGLDVENVQVHLSRTLSILRGLSLTESAPPRSGSGDKPVLH